MPDQMILTVTASTQYINHEIDTRLHRLDSDKWRVVHTSTGNHFDSKHNVTIVTVTILVEETSGSKAQKERLEVDKKLLDQPISILKLPTLITGSLEQGSIKTLRDLVGKNCRELVKLRNFSNLSLYRVIEALADRKLYLGYKID